MSSNVETEAVSVPNAPRSPRQWEPLALVPLFAGLYWLLANEGGGWLFWAFIPGSVMLASGVALLLMPGDSRITGLMALAAALGILLTPITWWVGGFGAAFLCTLTALGTFLTAGRVALTRETLYDGAPEPELNTAMDAKAAVDEAVLGYFVVGAKMPTGALAERVCEDAQKLSALIVAEGWDKDPAKLHPAPSAPDKIWWEKGRSLGFDFDVLRFESGFTPPEGIPAAAVWKTQHTNNTCAVRVMKHEGAPRPWLLCIHGYRMGVPLLDLSLFSPGFLHHRLGLNLLMPVLPLHGVRKVGARSGDHFLDGDPLDLLLAEMQSLWDLRRSLAWLRQLEPQARVGALGYSLGGYNTALLAGYEAQLDFAVAAIPAMDFPGLLWRHLPGDVRRYFNARGFGEAQYRALLAPVSPLSRPAALAKDRLLILGGTGDRLVPPSQPLLLARHWGVPVQWYQGSHLSVRRERETRDILREALLRAAWPGVA